MEIAIALSAIAVVLSVLFIWFFAEDLPALARVALGLLWSLNFVFWIWVVYVAAHFVGKYW